MKAYITIFLCTISFLAYSQDEVEWFELGTSWTYNWNNPFDPNQDDFTYTYSVSGIVEFLGKTCSKIEPIEVAFACLAESPPYYMYHANDTIYYATESMSEFAIGYILSEGAQWQYQTTINNTNVIFNATTESISSVNLGGIEMPTYNVLYEEDTNLGFVDIFPSERTIIIQIGDPNMFIIPFGKVGNCDLESNVVLRCFESPFFNYENSDFPTCVLGAYNIKQRKDGLVYPNPTSNFLFWDESFESVTIYDIQGRMVLQNNQTINSQSLSLAELDGGFYMVVITNEDGAFSQKLMVEK